MEGADFFSMTFDPSRDSRFFSLPYEGVRSDVQRFAKNLAGFELKTRRA